MSDTDRRFRRKLLCALALAPWLSAAHANPVGPQVVNGQASIVQQGPTLNITNTPGAIINWQGFSIGAGETTRFIQQSSASSVLNRVVGPDPSVLLGTLTSNGRVFLINPSGILVGEGARIDVAGLVASTLNLNNQDFLAGRLNFAANPAAGAVENRGSITTPSGGSVYLVGSGVTNSGIINSPQGDVLLAAGQSVKILDTSTPGVRVEITAGDNAAVNLGSIIARSGQIGIYAATLRNAGVINADQVVRGENGRIFLKASKNATLEAGSSISGSGDSGGSVTVQAEQGTLLASGSIAATGADGKGGEVRLLGRLVGLTDHASVDASGSSGGGTVLVGGDAHGANPDVQNAWRAYVGPDATIKADATVAGDGGKVVVWSDDLTRFYGSISAKGGPQGGNGGFVETSGHNFLDALGTVNTAAPNGLPGMWLLDPTDINIVATLTGTPTLLVGQLFQDNTAIAASQVTIAALTTALQAGNVTISTNNPAGTGTGNITWQSGANLDYNGLGTKTLTLNASNNITIAGNITDSVSGGDVLNVALNPGASGSATIGGTISLGGGTLSFGAASGGAVLSGGTIANATVTTTGGTGLRVTSGSLNAVTLRGALNLLGTSNTVRIFNGLTLLNEAGTAAGVANVTGNGAALVFDNGGTAVTFNNATINLGSATALGNLGIDNGGTLTLGSGVTVQGAGSIGNQFFVGGNATLINQGTISANLSGRTLTLQGNGASTFTNQGTLQALTGGALTLSPASWTNAAGATISANGATLNFNGTWSNAGTVNINTSTLNLGGTFRAADIGTLTRSASTINLTGTLDNTGATLNLGTSTPLGVLTMNGGTIVGGTVQENGGTGLAFGSGTLNGVTLRGVLDLSGTSSTARIFNGLTLLTETGTSPGAANVTGSGAALVFDSGTTSSFNNATINLGSATTLGNLDIDGAGTLTLGSGVTVQGAGSIGNQFFVGGAATLINQGTISANLSGRTLTIGGNGASTFTNQGTLQALSGATLTVNSTNWSNTRTISGNGGTLNFNGAWSSLTGSIDLTNSTLNLGGTFATADIGTLTRTGSTINLTGTLNNTGNTLNLGTSTPLGVLTMNGGTILGGTVQENGGIGLAFGSGTLNGVTLRGVLDLSGTSSTARIFNGLTLLTEAGTAPGTANVTGSGAALVFDSGTTSSFNNATINLGSATTLGNLDIDNGGTLTLGSGVTVQGAGSIGNQFFVGGSATLINQGTISANLSGRTLTIGGNGASTFTNQGTLQVLSGATLTINSANWSNTRTISASGATLNFNGAWSNAAGTVDINGSTLNLGGTFATADIGALTRTASTVNLTGTLNNTGSTLSVGTSTPLGVLTMNGGTILGGTVQENGGTGLAFGSGSLNGVTLRGVLDLSANSSTARIFNGLTLLTEAGTSPGVANVTGSSAALVFDSNTTSSFNNATVNLGSATTFGSLDIDGAGTLTLGSAVTVQGAGFIGNQFFVGGAATLINQGTISANLSGRTLTISGNGVSTFTNQGTMQALSGGTLTIGSANWSNAAGATISSSSATLSLNGVWTNSGAINATNSTLNLGNGTNAWSNAGTITSTNSTTNLGGSFTTAVINTLTLSGGTLNLTGTLNNSGATLSLGAATPLGILNMAGGTILGGTVQENGGTGLAFGSGSLNGVTLRGVLDLSANSSTARIFNGVTLLDETGAAPGVANVTGSSAALVFDSGTTSSFNNATINLGSATTSGSLGVDGAGTLTLGPGVTVQGSGFIGNQFFVGGAATLINQGTISANLSGRTLTLQGNGVSTFTNQGTMQALSGGTLTIGSANWSNAAGGTISAIGATLSLNGVWTNSGAINATNSTLNLGNSTNAWSNAGTITSTNSTTNLGGSFTTAVINTLTLSGGTLNLTGTLNNTGATLNLGTSTPLGVLTMNGGTILGGTVQENGGTGLAFGSGSLNGVTLRGVLDLSANSSTARIFNGLTLLTEAGSSPGVANVTGSSAALVFDSGTTSSFNNATINLGSATTSGSLGVDGAGTLTLGPGVTVQGSGFIGNQFFVGGAATLINQGTISANLSGRTLTISGNGVSTFDNQGVLSAQNGGTLNTPASFGTNNGVIDIGAGSLVNTNNTSLINSAAGTIRGSGTLRLVNAGVTTTRTLTNNGTLQPGGNGTTGTLTIIGDLVLGPTSVVQIDIQGTAAGQFGAIAVVGNGQPSVGGALTLAGQLNVSHLNGFTPGANTPFTIITFVSRSGDFAAINSPNGFVYTGTPAGAPYVVTAQAAPPNVWQGGLTGDWNVAANWSLGHVPTVNEDVQITLAGATITISVAGQAVRSLTDAETVVIAGGASLSVNGTLNIASGGTLTNGGTLTAGSLVVSGTLNANGVTAVSGAFSNPGTINIGTSGALALSLAATNIGIINIVAGGSLTAAGGFTNAATGTIAGNGLINLGTGTLTNQGTLRTGTSPGTLTIVGNLVLTPTSVVQIGIQAPGLVAGTDYDVIVVSGAATLDGTLAVTHLGGFAPSGGTSFQVMTFASHAGNFASISAGGVSYSGTPGASGFSIALLQALLQNIFLGNAGNNSWDVAANWSLGHVPTSGEDAVIPSGPAFVVIISAPEAAHSVASQQGLTIASTGTLALGGGNSTVSGTLTIAGGTLTNSGALTTDSFVLNAGAYGGSGSLTVTSAFSHLAGVFSTTGPVSITQATGNLTLTQPLIAGTLTINVPTGDLTVQDALVSSTGTMNVAVFNNLNVTAVGAPTELHADGAQTIVANGVSVQAGASGTGLSAKISSAGGQNITAGAGGIAVAAGAGGTNNFAMIEQDGATGDQIIAVNGGGSVTLNGGGGTNNSASIDNFGRAQTISFNGGGSLVLQGGSGASFSEADVTNFGDAATSQTIQFAGGGTIRLTGGTIGNDNFAEILAFTGNQTVTGNPDIFLTGGASGGAANHGNSADISMGLGSGLASSSAVQTINAHNLTLQGGAGGVENFALIGAAVPGQRQIINATGAVTLAGGTGGIDTGAVIGNPGAVTWGPFGDVNVVVNASGPITLASGSGAVGADGLGGRALIGAVGSFRADVTLGGQGVTLGAGSLVGSDTGGGTIQLSSGPGALAIDGAIKTTGAIILIAPDIVIGTGAVNAGTGTVTIVSTAANGAVSLGAGLSGLGLSNAELGRITAGTLLVNGGAITTDADVVVSGIGTIALAGASVQFRNNFSASGNLAVIASGDVTLSAGGTSVLVQASRVTIAARNVSLTGGTAADAFAAIQANSGDVTVAASGAVSITKGSLVDSDAWIIATGNITVTATSCSGCDTQVHSTSPLPWTNGTVDAGLAANGSITVQLGTPSAPSLLIADTNRNLPPPPPTPPLLPADTSGVASGNSPSQTDPNGTVGGQAGSFGGSDSGSSGSASGQGSGSGEQGKGGKPAKKANARC